MMADNIREFQKISWFPLVIAVFEKPDKIYYRPTDRLTLTFERTRTQQISDYYLIGFLPSGVWFIQTVVQSQLLEHWRLCLFYYFFADEALWEYRAIGILYYQNFSRFRGFFEKS